MSGNPFYYACCAEGDEQIAHAQTRRLRYDMEKDIKSARDADDHAHADYLQERLDNELKNEQSYIYMQVAGAICCIVIPLTLLGLLFAAAS